MSKFTQKPSDWDSVQAFTEYEPLELGGHVCRIMKVEEGKSKAGNDTVYIYLDIAEGEQKGYYSEQYRNDNRPDKKWGCIVYQLFEDRDGNTSRGFKTFVETVTASNPGFNANQIWNENFCNYFKDKLIGGIFGREQYRSPKDGSLKFSTKCRSFVTVEKARAGIPAPADKLLDSGTGTAASNPFAAMGFAEMPGSLADDLPF